MSGEKQSLEQEKFGIKEELVRVEQEKMDLDTEKMCKSCLLLTFMVISFMYMCLCQTYIRNNLLTYASVLCTHLSVLLLKEYSGLIIFKISKSEHFFYS